MKIEKKYMLLISKMINNYKNIHKEINKYNNKIDKLKDKINHLTQSLNEMRNEELEFYKTLSKVYGEGVFDPKNNEWIVTNKEIIEN